MRPDDDATVLDILNAARSAGDLPSLIEALAKIART